MVLVGRLLVREDQERVLGRGDLGEAGEHLVGRERLARQQDLPEPLPVVVVPDVREGIGEVPRVEEDEVAGLRPRRDPFPRLAPLLLAVRVVVGEVVAHRGLLGEVVGREAREVEGGEPGQEHEAQGGRRRPGADDREQQEERRDLDQVLLVDERPLREDREREQDRREHARRDEPERAPVPSQRERAEQDRHEPERVRDDDDRPLLLEERRGPRVHPSAVRHRESVADAHPPQGVEEGAERVVGGARRDSAERRHEMEEPGQEQQARGGLGHEDRQRVDAPPSPLGMRGGGPRPPGQDQGVRRVPAEHPEREVVRVEGDRGEGGVSDERPAGGLPRDPAIEPP